MNLDISNLEIVNISFRENSLVSIDVNGNQKEYDASNIESLVCSENQLTSFPLVPNGLKHLYCDGNSLISLPATLPKGLKTLACSGNQITFLPILPKELEYLDCSWNQLTSLPDLPEGLEELYCSSNRLTSLPILPKELRELDCFGNVLTSLSILPKKLRILRCEGNLLTFLPILSKELTTLVCKNNPLVFVQYLKKRPLHYVVPSHLEEKHSAESYQKNYVLQTLSRYLVCFFAQRSKYYNTFRIFGTILSESLL